MNRQPWVVVPTIGPVQYTPPQVRFKTTSRDGWTWVHLEVSEDGETWYTRAEGYVVKDKPT